MSRTRCAHGLSLCWQNALRSNSTGKPGSSRSMSSLLAKAARRWKGNRQLRGLHIGRSQFVGQGATVDMLSTALANQLGRPVMDRTGLAGNFNFKLNWTPPDAITPNSPDPLSTPDQSGPSIHCRSGATRFGAKGDKGINGSVDHRPRRATNRELVLFALYAAQHLPISSGARIKFV